MWNVFLLYVKIVNSVRVWPTYGSPEVRKNWFLSNAWSVIFPLPLWASLSHRASPPPKTVENGVTRRFAFPFCLKTGYNNFIEYSKSSFSGGSTDTNFSSLGLSWAEKSPFKATKIIQEVFASFWCWKASHESFLNLKMMIARLRIGLENWNWYQYSTTAWEWGLWICFF